LHGALALVGVLGGFYLGFQFAWAYWARAIVVWRLKAFASVNENRWLSLFRAAVKNQLIWPDGHEYEKTEKRCPEENLRILNIRTRLRELEKEELVNDDFATPSKLELYWNYQNPVIQVLLFSFPMVLGLAGIVRSEGEAIISWVVLAIGIFCFYSIRKLLPHLLYRGIALTIDKEKIASLVPKEVAVSWTDVNYVYFTDEPNELVIEGEEADGTVKYTTYDLDLYRINDKQLFKRQVNVFANRHIQGLSE
jgi:hypothetical protein